MLIAALILVTLNTYPILVSQDLIFQSKQSSMQSKAAVVASALNGLESMTAEGVAQVIELLDDMNISRLIVADSSALVLYDTSQTDSAVGRHAFFSEICEALRGKDVFYSAYDDGAFRSRAAMPVTYRGSTIGAVYIYEYDAEQAGLLLGFRNNLKNLSIGVSVVLIVLSLLFSGAITRRIGAILRSVKSVSEGEYGNTIKLRGTDELTELASEFNKMTARLQTTEEMRRRFVSDASHELKTPLASIRLLTDSILQTESMDKATVREFVGDIGEEADRLARMTEKLLGLSRLEEKKLSSDEKAVDVKQVVVRVIHTLRPLADVHGVTLKEAMDDGCIVTATEDNLHQVVFNLMENGIKYNTAGGAVQVLLYKKERKVILIVEDTGIGIPEEDIPRIFERFYRVDKARSRESESAGGSGIGLSIVKETMEKYGGEVTVARRESGGTRFTLTFPEKAVEQ